MAWVSYVGEKGKEGWLKLALLVPLQSFFYLRSFNRCLKAVFWKHVYKYWDITFPSFTGNTTLWSRHKLVSCPTWGRGWERAKESAISSPSIWVIPPRCCKRRSFSYSLNQLLSNVDILTKEHCYIINFLNLSTTFRPLKSCCEPMILITTWARALENSWHRALLWHIE